MIVFAPIVGLALACSVAGENLRKSRPRKCPAGLVVRAIIDRLGRKMTVCVKPTPPGILDPLHTAKHDLDGATHVLRVPGEKGPEYIASHGVPAKTTLGQKLDRILHPLQHFDEDEVHAIPIHPESRGRGHDATAAYHHAVGKVVIRGADGEPFAVTHVTKRDADGNPTVYRVSRLPEYRRGRIGRRAGDPDEHVFHRGGGIDVTPAQLEYLMQHPPRTGVGVGPTGEVFGKWARMALPAVDSDGRAVPGRAPRVRYDILLHPSVYGGEAGYQTLKTAPGWNIEEDEPTADARFRDYMDLARRRFFPREADRPAAGEVDELIRRHNGDIGQVIESGDLGHENVARESRKQHTVAAKKPIAPRDLTKLVALWRAQHPGLIEAARGEIRRQHPGFNDDAQFDEVVDGAIETAIHRFDPQVNPDFTRYARSIMRGQLRDAAQRRGAEYGALREAAGAPLQPFDADRAEVRDEAGEEPPARAGAARVGAHPQAAPSRKTLRIYDRSLGSQAEFDKVLEAALPEEPDKRRVISALYPTGNFVAGAAYKEAAAKTGLPQEHFFQYLPVVQRIKQHPSYQRYRDRYFRQAEEERDEAEALARALNPEAPPLLRVVSAIEGEVRHFQLAKRLRGPRSED